MAIPYHSDECSTKTFPCNCPDCSKQVYFLSCTCGSKVFFNELGHPWTEHKCVQRRIRESIELMQDSDNKTSDEIYKFIETNGGYIPTEYLDYIQNILGKRNFDFSVVEIPFDPSIISVTGRIMNINSDINFYKKIGARKEDDMATKLLGELVKEIFCEVTLRENPNNTNQSKQFTLYASKRFIKQYFLNRGNHIAVEIRPAKSTLNCWVCVQCQKI